MRFSVALSTVLTSLGLQHAQAGYGREEEVTISDVRIHKIGSPVGASIPSISFKINGDDAKDLECSGTDLPWPEPNDITRCGDSNYAFLLWPGEDGIEFGMMIYHDVGDAKADLRGGINVDTECDNSQGSGPADEICSQKAPITFKIDGPVKNDAAEL